MLYTKELIKKNSSKRRWCLISAQRTIMIQTKMITKLVNTQGCHWYIWHTKHFIVSCRQSSDGTSEEIEDFIRYLASYVATNKVLIKILKCLVSQLSLLLQVLCKIIT